MRGGGHRAFLLSSDRDQRGQRSGDVAGIRGLVSSTHERVNFHSPSSASGPAIYIFLRFVVIAATGANSRQFQSTSGELRMKNSYRSIIVAFAFSSVSAVSVAGQLVLD